MDARMTWLTTRIGEIDAERRLEVAAERLQQAQVEALLGIRYDADEMDALILEYRSARRAAEVVRREAARRLVTALALPAPQAFSPEYRHVA